MADSAAKVTKVVINTTDEFDSAVADLSGDVFLLFYGERKEDGNSWCPDCTAALPIVEAALEAREAPSTLVEVTVARDEYKGKPEYAYRVHSEVALQAIPQLVKWVDGKSAAALVEADVQVAAKVAELTA